MNLPQRGEVWLADLGMIAKTRPVLVLSIPFGDRDYALFHVVPHTTSARGSQFEVGLNIAWLGNGVFNIKGSLSIPRTNLIRLLGILSDDELGRIEESFRRWLQL